MDILKNYANVLNAVVVKITSFGVANVMFSRGGKKWCYLPNTKQAWAPHLEYIHCMAHHTNLTMQILFQIPIVKHIEDLLQSFIYFILLL